MLNFFSPSVNISTVRARDSGKNRLSVVGAAIYNGACKKSVAYFGNLKCLLTVNAEHMAFFHE
jgi:hypothetical protein